jgi:hypothetical protein
MFRVTPGLAQGTAGGGNRGPSPRDRLGLARVEKALHKAHRRGDGAALGLSRAWAQNKNTSPGRACGMVFSIGPTWVCTTVMVVSAQLVSKMRKSPQPGELLGSRHIAPFLGLCRFNAGAAQVRTKATTAPERVVGEIRQASTLDGRGVMGHREVLKRPPFPSKDIITARASGTVADLPCLRLALAPRELNVNRNVTPGSPRRRCREHRSGACPGRRSGR